MPALLNPANKLAGWLPLVLALMPLPAVADVTVYAAASMTNAIDDINKLYQTTYHTRVKSSYAASSTLAKQIEQGAGAEVFISADTDWMDYLAKKNPRIGSSYKNLLGNRLVLITPKANPVRTPIVMNKNFAIGNAFSGKLCTGNTDSVPVGRYAKQALTNLGWWATLKPRLVETEDVRAALNFVNRGECQLGIVYATDAAIAGQVKVAGVFPLATHQPIVYPLALLSDNADARRYYQFLQSPAAKAIYRHYGFTVLAQ